MDKGTSVWRDGGSYLFESARSVEALLFSTYTYPIYIVGSADQLLRQPESGAPVGGGCLWNRDLNNAKIH